MRQARIVFTFMAIGSWVATAGMRSVGIPAPLALSIAMSIPMIVAWFPWRMFTR